jgi:hypothetical protein
MMTHFEGPHSMIGIPLVLSCFLTVTMTAQYRVLLAQIGTGGRLTTSGFEWDKVSVQVTHVIFWKDN